MNYRLVCAGAYIEHPFEDMAHAVVKRLILEYNIVSLPGSYFGQQQETFIRFAIANVSEVHFSEVVHRLIESQNK